MAEKQQTREPTARQIKAAKLMSENVRNDKPKTKGEILLEAGYSEEISKAPSKITNSEVFQRLLEQYLPDERLTTTHRRLLDTRKIEHMVFPLGPSGEDDINLSGSKPNSDNQIEKAGVPVERTTLTDVEIIDMLAEVNCKVKRIVHGDTARHVYFWAYDANAQIKALDLAYKLKGVTAPEKGNGNTFIFNNGQSSQNFLKK